MNQSYRLLLLLQLTFTGYYSDANNITKLRTDTIIACDTLFQPDSLARPVISTNHEVFKFAVNDSLTVPNFKAKKFIAALLAFPVPFGLLGLHRIFLGTKPYIPFVYIGTLGGCFLILPIIDFIAIVSSNEETFKLFENNPRVFIWSR